MRARNPSAFHPAQSEQKISATEKQVINQRIPRNNYNHRIVIVQHRLIYKELGLCAIHLYVNKPMTQ